MRWEAYDSAFALSLTFPSPPPSRSEQNLQLFDRLIMLRMAERPEELDEALPLESLDTIPWSAVLHCAVGVWMYGSACSRYVFGGMESEGLGWDMSQGDQFNIKKRIFKTAGLPQFCAFLAVSFILPMYFFSRSVSVFFKGLTTKQSRNGFEGMDPAVLSIPVLRRIRPAYVLRPEDASVAGSKAGSEMSEFDLTKEREEPPDPGAKIIKLKTAHMTWTVRLGAGAGKWERGSRAAACLRLHALLLPPLLLSACGQPLRSRDARACPPDTSPARRAP